LKKNEWGPWNYELDRGRTLVVHGREITPESAAGIWKSGREVVTRRRGLFNRDLVWDTESQESRNTSHKTIGGCTLIAATEYGDVEER